MVSFFSYFPLVNTVRKNRGPPHPSRGGETCLSIHRGGGVKRKIPLFLHFFTLLLGSLCVWIAHAAAPIRSSVSARRLRPAGNSDVFISSSLILVRLPAQIPGREADIIFALGPSPAFYLPPSIPGTSRSGAPRSRCLRWRQRCAWN